MMRLARFSLGLACLAACTIALAAGQTGTSYVMPRDALNAAQDHAHRRQQFGHADRAFARLSDLSPAKARSGLVIP